MSTRAGLADRQLARKNRNRYRLTIILFLLPTIVGIVLFQFGPLAMALRNSLFNMNLLKPDAATFVGLDNYVRMLNDAHIFTAFRNTLAYTAGKVFLQVPFALLLAILVHQQLKGIGIVRSAIFAPVVTSVTVVAVVWNLMYHPENGLINSFLQTIGLPRQPLLTSTSQALPAILVMSIWQDTGFTMLILLAGLQGIPDLYYEAAAIDGANRLQQFWHITLPLLRRTLLYAVVITTIFSFTVFTPVYVMTKGGPQESTRLAVYYIWEQGFKFLDMGYASAMAVLLMLLMLVITVVQGRILRTEFEY